jgi:hypothetical protein
VNANVPATAVTPSVPMAVAEAALAVPSYVNGPPLTVMVGAAWVGLMVILPEPVALA